MGCDEYQSYNYFACHASTLIGVYHRIGRSVLTDSCCSCVVAFKKPGSLALHCTLYMYSTVQ